MVDIICAIVAAIATIICAVITAFSVRAERQRRETEANTETLNSQRAKEARLQLSMIDANSKLTVGVAMALKNGHANGEVEEGLRAVNTANAKYAEFLEEVALEHMKG